MSVLLLDCGSAEAASIASWLGDAGLTTVLGESVASKASSTDIFDAILVGGRGRVEQAMDTCADLRRAGYRGAVVVLGTRDHPDDRVAALERGADHFLPRPFSARELVACVQAVLRRGTSQSKMRWGAIVIDRAEHAAYLHGRPLKLTAREYALLACLTEAGGKMVSRSDLLERVWRRSNDANSNLIEAHMSRLRDKLGADSTVIETVRRSGYRLRR